MASPEVVEEEFRLALAQPKLPPDVRREAATAFTALTDHRARLVAAEGRYDDGEDLDGLDEALRVFRSDRGHESLAGVPGGPARRPRPARESHLSPAV